MSDTSDFDEDAFVEDFDYLARTGLSRARIAERMGVTRDCLDARVMKAQRRGKMARTNPDLYPAGYLAAGALGFARV